MRGISKSLYCSGVQCPKMLWMKKYMPELEEQMASETVFENGNRVGDLAMGLLGDFTEVEYADDKTLMLDKTLELLDAGTEVICEASFAYNGLFCSVDILRNYGDGVFDFYEVKSSTSIHDVYYKDTAFQLYVLTQLGYTVKRVYIVHVDNSYVLDGDLDIHSFFSINDVTDIVSSMQEETGSNLAFLQAYLEQSTEPAHALHQGCFSPYACGFWKHCACDLPEYNVFDLTRMTKGKMLDLYNSGKKSFADVQYEDLTDGQRLQVDTVLSGEEYIEPDAVKSFLESTVSFPLYFLDFETFQPAIPLYQGTKPYQQIPFQYSLHIIGSESDAPEDAVHHEFIAEPGTDPRRALAERLCRDIPRGVCVLAYNMSFEKGRIKELADQYPDLSSHLMDIHDNIADLIIPFRKHFVYYPAMNGSSSIKSVLPAMFPDDPSLDYHSLEGVQKGDEASAVYESLASMTPEERAPWLESLYRYCELDTFAMVKIWKKLTEIGG